MAKAKIENGVSSSKYQTAANRESKENIS